MNDQRIYNASSKPELSEALTAMRRVEYLARDSICRARSMLALVRLCIRSFVCLSFDQSEFLDEAYLAKTILIGL